MYDTSVQVQIRKGEVHHANSKMKHTISLLFSTLEMGQTAEKIPFPFFWYDIRCLSPRSTEVQNLVVSPGVIPILLLLKMAKNLFLESKNTTKK